MERENNITSKFKNQGRAKTKATPSAVLKGPITRPGGNEGRKDIKVNRLHYDIGFGWGMGACQRNEKRIPAADSRVLEFIKENCKEACSSVSVLKGWIDGYAWQIDEDMKAKGF
ncbi:MAG: hypothetical protein RR235_07985 [Oscillospiraceae bacterium]